MRRLVLILSAVAALSAWGITSAPLVSAAPKVTGGADRIEAITADAVPRVASTMHPARNGQLSGITPSAAVPWALAMCLLLGVLALTRPVARSQARSWLSRAPPRPLS